MKNLLVTVLLFFIFSNFGLKSAHPINSFNVSGSIGINSGEARKNLVFLVKTGDKEMYQSFDDSKFIATHSPYRELGFGYNFSDIARVSFILSHSGLNLNILPSSRFSLNILTTILDLKLFLKKSSIMYFKCTAKV